MERAFWDDVFVFHLDRERILGDSRPPPQLIEEIQREANTRVKPLFRSRTLAWQHGDPLAVRMRSPRV